MRLLPLFLLIFLFFDVNEAQRRTTAKPDSSSVTPRPASRGRGRSRFVSTPDYEQSQGSGSIPQEPTGRRVSSRKRVTENTEQRIPPRVVGALLKTESFARVPNVTPKTETLPRISNSATKPERTSARVANSVPRAEVAEKKSMKHESTDRRAFSSRTVTTESSQRSQSLNPSKNSYEVQEVIDEPVAFEPIRRAKKLRLSTSENQQNDLKSIPRRNSLQNLPTESPEAFKSTVKNSATSESSVVSLPPEDSNIVEGADDTTLETVLEVSSESPVLPEEQPITPSSQIPDTPKTSEPARGQNSRRNGARRTPGATDQTTTATRSRTRARASKTPEVLFEAAVPTRSSRRRTGGPSVFTAEVTQNEPRSRTGRTIESSPEKVTINLTSRRGRRNSTPSSAPRTTTKTTASPRKRQPTERSSRSRSRSRDAPPVLDETKLEVLPLFEAEPSIVNSVRGRSRSRTVQPDNFLMSATETNNKVTKAMPPKEVETATQVAARGESSRGKEVRQSVVAEVNQVVSRGTVSRKKSSTGVKIKAFDPLARGSKKAETRRSEKEKKNSSEEIEESDNYPEHFKALLKAKKGEESSAEKITRSGPTITNIVTASSFPSRISSGVSSTTISYALKESNELDNELFPKTSSTTTPIPRTPRSRSSRTPSETLAPPTGTATTVPTRQKHSKNSELTRRTNGGVAFKPKEAGSRRDRDNSGRGKQQQVPTKVSKLVSTAVNVDRRKYRSDSASRSALTRSTTNAPRYIPTIPSMPYVPTVPTFTPQRTSVFSRAVKKDPDLGVEVISFDDPVPPLVSENLVRDKSVSTENPLSIALPLVSEGTTEKPVSIFERIINSLTAISTPAPVTKDFSGLSSTTESGSAILKLAPKKLDYDDTAQTLLTPTTFTTDKSTTIIEKILSSINAIQATDNTRSSQVRTDFNTLSFTTTTPVSALTNTDTDSTLTLPAQFGTSSIDPLSVLNEITPEQALQKRTIGKLLEILNGMVSTTLQPQKLVVVTPKSFSFASAVNTDGTGMSSDSFPSTTLLPSTTTEPSTIPSSTTTEMSSTLPSSTEMIAGDFTTPADSIMVTSTSDSKILVTSSTATESQTSTTSLPSTTESTTTSSTESTSFPSTSEVGISNTVDPYYSFSLLSTLPSLQKFEVSPGSVSVFSANDLSNSITTEDNFSTTVSIQSRSNNFDDTATTQASTTTDSATTFEPTTTESFISTTEETMMTTTDITTTMGTTTPEASTVNINKDLPNRSGRLLNFLQDPIQNSIDFSTPSTTTSTTPDYYVFAVLNNNTILRKKPARVPDKSTPYFIVGVYPDNTVVKRYPNGTMVPTERVIRVRGFDTRENPPPLPEITSNQVTNERGLSEEDGRNVQTPEQSSLPSFEANPLSLNSGSTSTTAATNLASSSTPERSPRTNNRVFTSTTTPVSTTRPSATTAEVLAGTTRASAGTTEGSLSSTEVATEVLSGSTQTPMGTTLSGLVDMVTEESSTVTSTGPGTNPTLSALSELFDGRTLNALNEIVNSVKTNTDTVTTTSQVVKVDATTLQPEMSSTLSTIGTTLAPLTTTEILFTESGDTVTTESSRVTISNDISEGKSSSEISTTSFPTTTSTSTTTTGRIPSTTKIVRLTTTPTNVQSTFPTRLPEAVPTAPLLPTFLTTLFPNLFAAEVPATRAPRVLTTKTPGIIRISAPPSVTENMLVAASTTRATTIAPPSTIVTTVVPSRTTPKVTTRSTTITTTTRATTTTPKATTTTPRPTTTTQRTTTTPRATTTPQTTTVRPTTESTTLPITTTNSVPSTSTVIVATTDTTTTESEILTNLNAIETTSKKPLKVLTAEQKQNLRTLMQLEKEQAALLQQLSFLTNLNFGKAATPRKSNNEKSQKQTNKNLADRVVALAVERDKTAKTTTQKPPASIQDQLAAIDATRKPKQVTPSIEEVLRQYNLGDLDIATTPGTSYGKSNDAILASLLKQQGIAPPTPKSLADQIKQAGLFDDPTTRKPKPKPKPRPKTTPPPGRLMQGLNWLLNALAPTPPPTPRPTRKPAKPKRPPVDQQEELLTNSPTHVTPVVTAAPSKLAGGASSKKNMLSQEDIQKLIAQLEGLQKDSNKQSLDLSQIKSLQNLINTDEGVVVLANGEHGSTPRRTATPTGTRTTTARPTSVGTTRRRQERKLTTVSSNRLEEEEDEFEVTTKKHKAPIGFRPVPGVDDESSESLVRSNLITAAVNVTKAISGFLGTALQGAAQSFQTLWGSGSALGSRVLGAASGSSGGPG